MIRVLVVDDQELVRQATWDFAIAPKPQFSSTQFLTLGMMTNGNSRH